MATREQLLAWGICKRKTIEVDAEVSLTIQEMNAEALDKINNHAGDKNALGLVLSVVNEDGTPVFSEEDIKTIAKQFSVAKLIKIGDIIMEFNGLRTPEEDTAKK